MIKPSVCLKNCNLLMLLSVAILLLGCKSQQITGNWANERMQVDGRIDDWSGMAVSSFEEQNAVMALSNDSSFLYIHFRTRDIRFAKAIMMSGLTIYLNGNGKKDKDFFIKYRGGPTKEMLAAIQGPYSNRKSDRFMERPENAKDKKAPLFSCYIKDVIIEKPIPENGAQGPSAAFDTAYSFFSYEFAIPLADPAVRYYGLGVEAGKQIAVGAEWGELENMQFDRSDLDGGAGKGGGGRPPGGMGGGPSGGFGGGKGGGGDRNMGIRPGGIDKQELWFKTTLKNGPDPTSSEN